jgi:hypothetical protein
MERRTGSLDSASTRRPLGDGLRDSAYSYRCFGEKEAEQRQGRISQSQEIHRQDVWRATHKGDIVTDLCDELSG